MITPHTGIPFTFDEAVDQACHLVASDDSIGSVHVVFPRRPTYAELLAAREAASTNGLELRLRASGDLTVRRPEAAAAPEISRHIPMPHLSHLRLHLPHATLGLPNLSEGTR